MKWLLKLSCCCLLLLFASSCISTSAFVRYEERKIESIEEARTATKLMLDGWLFRSGVIHGVIEPIKHELPQQTIEAMKDLDILAKKYHDEGGLSDQDLGLALGLRIQMLSGTVKAIIEQYAPEVFKYLPVM